MWSSDCLLISREKSNHREDLVNERLEVEKKKKDIFRLLHPFRLVCIWSLKSSLSKDKPVDDGPAFLLC